MVEDLAPRARRLAEALKGFVETAESSDRSGSAEAEGGASGSGGFEPERQRVLESAKRLGLREAWSAVREARSGIDDEEGEAARAHRHARLDSAALALAELAVARRSELHQQLVQDIAHDIRSPLNSILMLADSLLNGPGPMNAVQRRQAGVLYDASVALVRLVNDVIDAAGLGPKGEVPVGRAPFSIPDLLDEVRGLVQPLADHRAVELVMEAEGSRRRLGDRQLLCRVLVNLSSNGVEAAGRAGGRVDVRVGEDAGGALRAEIVNSGPEADIGTLREIIRVDAEPYLRRYEGWTRGLGLSIAARLVAAADGELAVDRLEDGRTCFLVRLPFEPI